MNKRKIINDPVYGFITIPHPLLFDLIEHPWFQRLRRIRQLGLGHMVYPGALHTRFHHALGALHLITQAIDTLRSKGHEITDEEALAVEIAILLHDIGHSPFSHALENSIVTGISHETVSLLIMERLNAAFDGQLSLAMRIFKGEYHKHFLHQMISSQLDMDRLDYLNRDSFYTGVLEGKIGAQRIIRMLDVHEGRLVVEEKGVYSIEKFIIARRLMYWQVYLHKTVLAAEQLLVNILLRAKELTVRGESLFGSPALLHFLKNSCTESQIRSDVTLLETYLQLDDYDVFGALKVWASHSDPVLSRLCNGMVNRKLYKIQLRREPFSSSDTLPHRTRAQEQFGINEHESRFFAFEGSISNNAYDPKGEPIRILFRDGSSTELLSASDQMEVAVLSSPIQKHYLCVLPELGN
ncbi:MAG: HD domain-containing protein [Sphingobacteriales bacterium]|jgi:HD superfamily phosphohydrolase|nr:HD domain-containing protein [Sphingobacteriales bacterium]